MQIASRKFYLKHSALYLPQCTANGMRNRRLRQPKSITKLAKKRAWEPPGASKIDPKWLPGRSRDISGAPGAIPSLWGGLPDAPGERQGRPKEPPTSSWDVPRSLPETSKSDPGAKKTRTWSVFALKKVPFSFSTVFLRFFIDF